MELTGDLSDFGLADILQILALSRKTGTLSLAGEGRVGKIVIERGRITQASCSPGDTLAERLIKEEILSWEDLSQLRRVCTGGGGEWTLETLIIESGIMRSVDLQSIVSRHVREVVGCLVTIEKGAFGINLNNAEFSDVLNECKLGKGLEVGEVLLEAAKQRDEEARRQDKVKLDLEEWLSGEESTPPNSRVKLPASDNDRSFRYLSSSENNMNRNGSSRLCSILGELQSNLFESEVSLLVMRFASEVMARGVLFGVMGEELFGLGQFGLTGNSDGKLSEDVVRSLRIPINEDNVFGNVVRTGNPFVGVLSEGYWHSELMNKLNGYYVDVGAVVLPMLCGREVAYLFYGDNYPRRESLKGVQELMALVNQASILVEKIRLERVLSSLRGE